MIRALAVGGAFNPPTKAHLDLAEYAMKAVGAERTVFIPSKMTYVVHDQKKNFSFTDQERLLMLEKAAFNRPWMDVCPYEIEAETQPRTYETLCRLREDGYELKLLFGSDKLPELEHGWMYVDKICREFGIVCLSRGSDSASSIIRDNPYLSARREYITCLRTPDEYRNISSTGARKLFLQLKKNPADSEAMEALKQILPDELEGLKEWL